MSGHDSKYFSTTKKGEIPELKEELNSQYKDKRKDAVKKVIVAEPRRRILYLGGRSFELEEASVDSIGRRSISIVERGQGLRRSVVLVGFETRWIVAKLRAASLAPDHFGFLGRLHGGSRSVAVWVRGEEGVGSSFQVVVTVGTRRAQIFIPSSEFGGGWGDVALVFEGFGLGDGWVQRPGSLQRKVLSPPGPVSLPPTGASGGVTVAHTTAEADWFRLLDRSLVGQIRDMDGRGLSFADISDWVSRWWKFSAKVEVRPLGNQAFLFVLPTRREAETILRRCWTIGGCVLELGWWNPLALCDLGSSSPSARRVWIQVVGLPIHLRGLEVYRQIGNLCGGFVAVDESSVDMGSVRLCVTSSAHIPSRASLRWGSWTFSLPIWVEEGPTVELAVTEADQRLDKAGRDPRSWNRSIPKFLGVKDYLRRFKGETEFRGIRVRTPGQSGSQLGFSAELGPTTLGQAKAQRAGFCPRDTNKWVRPVVPTVVGPMTAVGNQKQLVDHLSQPNPCGFRSGQPNDPNPSISRVFASLHAGVGSRNTVRAVGLSAEAALSTVEVVALQSSQCLADAGPPVGVVGGETMELQSLLGSSDDGCHLGKTVSVTEECSQEFLGCPDKRGFVEDVGNDCGVDSVGELVLVACPEVPSHGDPEVARIHEEDLESLKNEYATVQLDCNASVERAQLLASEVTSLGEKRVAEEVVFSSLVVDGEVVPQFPSADGLALVLQPLAMEDGGSDDLRDQHQNLTQNSGGLDGFAIPSSEAVSNWVLERIGEVSRCLGVSFVGHEEEAMRLFAAVEASWRQGIPSSGVGTSFNSPAKTHRELKKLECTINYDHGRQTVGRGTRKERGGPLLLE